MCIESDGFIYLSTNGRLDSPGLVWNLSYHVYSFLPTRVFQPTLAIEIIHVCKGNHELQRRGKTSLMNVLSIATVDQSTWLNYRMQYENHDCREYAKEMPYLSKKFIRTLHSGSRHSRGLLIASHIQADYTRSNLGERFLCFNTYTPLTTHCIHRADRCRCCSP